MMRTGVPATSDTEAPRMQWTQLDFDNVVMSRAGPDHGVGHAEDEDEGEEPAGGRRDQKTQRAISSTRLQRQLALLGDNTRLRQLITALKEQRRFEDMRRLEELRCPDVNHDWIWSINPAHGEVMIEHEYRMAMRQRLGAQITAEPL
eukprot:4881530-Karenia_brevis.AAC.1